MPEIWGNVFWRNLKLKNFEILETLAFHFLFFWDFRIPDFYNYNMIILCNDEKSKTRNFLRFIFPAEFLEKLGCEFSFDKKHETLFPKNEPTFLFLGEVIPITNQRTDSHPCIRFLRPCPNITKQKKQKTKHA